MARMSVIRNWLGAEFRFTPPGCGDCAPAACSAANPPRAAVPATIPNMLRRWMPVLEFNIGVLLRFNIIGRRPACQMGAARNPLPRRHAIIPSVRADVAKLADALDLGSSSREGV